MLDINEVALSALLHDFGRLLDNNGMGTLAQALRERGFSGAVFDGNALSPEELVACAAAELMASSMAETPGKAHRGSNAPLGSVFEYVNIEDLPASKGRWTYPPGEYGKGGISAYLPGAQVVDYSRTREESMNEMARRLGELEGRSSSVVMNLLERYGSRVRSAGGDIALFDRSRTTAAVAVCMAGHLNETGVEPARADIENKDALRYLFVRGDISGVQKFIYTLTSRGALRMLRARSFYLELVAEHAVAEILESAGVPRTNVILVGGGGFQLLLPNTKTSKKAVETVERDLNDALEKSFGHGLYLALAKTSCGALGITGGGLVETLMDLSKELSGQKARKFHESLPRLFADQGDPRLESCDVCARDDAPVATYDSKGYEPWRGPEGEGQIKLCETCHMLAQASLKLVRSKYLVQGGDLHVGGTGYELSGDPQNALYALDGVGDEACLNGAVPLPAARYAMQDGEGQVMDFDGLSKRAAGVSRLAVLRMDVDNLGELFRSGLPRDMRSFDRYAALSRAFTTFFKMVVPLILAGGYENSLNLFGEKHERAATVVYSGGDDLFVVGAWSDILELAVDVRRAFKEFVCENPSVTLSGGISIHKSGEPLYLMAEAAGAAEEAAKNNERNGRKKDSVVLFYEGPDARKVENTVPEALFWDEVEGVVELLKQIDAFRKPDGKLPFPRGFTRLLLDVVDVYEREGHLSLPRLAYALARMEEGGKLRESRNWQELKRKLLEIETIEKRLRSAATWLDLAEREKGDADG